MIFFIFSFQIRSRLQWRCFKDDRMILKFYGMKFEQNLTNRRVMFDKGSAWLVKKRRLQNVFVEKRNFIRKWRVWLQITWQFEYDSLATDYMSTEKPKETLSKKGDDDVGCRRIWQRKRQLPWRMVCYENVIHIWQVSVKIDSNHKLELAELWNLTFVLVDFLNDER